MGFLSEKARNAWNSFKDALHAHDDLKNAIEAHDLAAARTAISHTRPAENPGDDRVIELVREYAKSGAADPAFFRALCDTIYEHYDQKTGEKSNDRPQKAAYNHSCRIYGAAAYLNDADKLRELGASGIKPDHVSNNGSLRESIVTGTARQCNFEAMKEVIRQGASLDRGFGWDEYSPLHAFSKPLFHAFHPGVTKALLETGDTRIIEAVNIALAGQKSAPNGP